MKVKFTISIGRQATAASKNGAIAGETKIEPNEFIQRDIDLKNGDAYIAAV